MLSLQALLAAPQADDPQDAVVAKQYISENQLYRKTAEEWYVGTGSSDMITLRESGRIPVEDAEHAT